jgi:hypothetical protein
MENFITQCFNKLNINSDQDKQMIQQEVSQNFNDPRLMDLRIREDRGFGPHRQDNFAPSQPIYDAPCEYVPQQQPNAYESNSHGGEY